MFPEIKSLLSLSFEIARLREENEFINILNNYHSKEIELRIDDFFYNVFLTSNLPNLQEILINISKFGLKAYSNWKLSFPLYPKIDEFENDFINERLKLYENELTSVLLKILLFLRDNFEPLSTEKQNLLLPFLSEQVLDNKFPNLNSDFKIGWHENHIRTLEKTLSLKVLYYAYIGQVNIKSHLSNTDISKTDSNLKKHIYFKNKQLIESLQLLLDDSTLNYQYLIKLLSASFHHSNSEQLVKAFNIEREYSKEFSGNQIKFQEDRISLILDTLEPYFSENDFISLKSLLEGEFKFVPQKLIFQQTAVSLTYFLKVLYEDRILISTSKKSLARWIIQNFRCLHNNSPIDFKQNTVEKNLKPDSKPPKLILSLD